VSLRVTLSPVFSHPSHAIGKLLSLSGTAPQVVADRNPLMGFGKVTIRLAVTLAAAFVLVTIFPSLVFATALVPANTLMAHFFIWNVLTAPFVETSFIGVVVACGVTLLVGKQLEPLWGSKEMLRFILVVTVSTSAATFFTCIFLYASSQQLHFIYDPIHGYCGLTGAYLVAVKQLLPEQQTKLCGVLKAKTKDLAGLYVVAYMMFFVIFNGHFGEFLFVSYGTFSGWFYLRFFQPRDGGVVGDQHNEAFGFISFFPSRLHPPVTVLTTACFRIAEQCPCCTTLHEQKRKVVNVMKHQALPGHTQSEAERYRSR
jgi:membrane associated rhomboid family serine protease